MRRIDYDTEQHRDYARGRAMSVGQYAAWMTAFTEVLPSARPLHGVDVGSGTGRFAPALADAFGPVAGVEPSVRMRSVALTDAGHPRVRYLAGSAEALPLPDDSADYALFFCSWHHVQDRAASRAELARTLRPGGRVLLRSNFRDHHPHPWWLGFFPGAQAADEALFPPLHETIADFTGAGWTVTDFRTVVVQEAGTRADLLDRLRLRTLSFFAQLDEADLRTGFDRLERAVADAPDEPVPPFAEPLLTLERRPPDAPGTSVAR